MQIPPNQDADHGQVPVPKGKPKRHSWLCQKIEFLNFKGPLWLFLMCLAILLLACIAVCKIPDIQKAVSDGRKAIDGNFDKTEPVNQPNDDQSNRVPKNNPDGPEKTSPIKVAFGDNPTVILEEGATLRVDNNTEVIDSDLAGEHSIRDLIDTPYISTINVYITSAHDKEIRIYEVEMISLVERDKLVKFLFPGLIENSGTSAEPGLLIGEKTITTASILCSEGEQDFEQTLLLKTNCKGIVVGFQDFGLEINLLNIGSSRMTLNNEVMELEYEWPNRFFKAENLLALKIQKSGQNIWLLVRSDKKWKVAGKWVAKNWKWRAHLKQEIEFKAVAGDFRLLAYAGQSWSTKSTTMFTVRDDRIVLTEKYSSLEASVKAYLN
jgi:hypothetical protein